MKRAPAKGYPRPKTDCLPVNRPPWVCDPCPQANGLPQTQPRATPWETPTPKPHSALKGPNHSANRSARPFRADATIDTPFP